MVSMLKKSSYICTHYVYSILCWYTVSYGEPMYASDKISNIRQHFSIILRMYYEIRATDYRPRKIKPTRTQQKRYSNKTGLQLR